MFHEKKKLGFPQKKAAEKARKARVLPTFHRVFHNFWKNGARETIKNGEKERAIFFPFAERGRERAPRKKKKAGKKFSLPLEKETPLLQGAERRWRS